MKQINTINNKNNPVLFIVNAECFGKHDIIQENPVVCSPTVPRWYHASLRQVLVSPPGRSTLPVPGFVTGTGRPCSPLPSILVLEKESNLHRCLEIAKCVGVSSVLFGS